MKKPVGPKRVYVVIGQRGIVTAWEKCEDAEFCAHEGNSNRTPDAVVVYERVDPPKPKARVSHGK